MSSVDLKINNTTHYGIEEIYVPKADGSGDAIFIYGSNVTPHLDINGIFLGNATAIDDVDGWITCDIPDSAYSNKTFL